MEENEEPDKTLQLLVEGYTKTYKEYMEALVGLPTIEEEEEEESESKMGNTSKIFLQEIRFEALRRNLAEVNNRIKKDGLESITAVYAKVKAKKISDWWNRVELEDEEIQMKESTEIYNETYLKLESEVEDMLVFLHEKMQPEIDKVEGLKLCRVSIPKFNGDYFKWVTFRDLFKTMVLDYKQLSNSQRMQLLKTNLTGEAERLVSDLTISEVNMQCAWDRLVHRFENNKVVVYKLLTKVTTQPMQKGDAKSMKSMLDLTDQTLLALHNLGRPTEHWDDWVILCVSQKFTSDLHREWEKCISNSTELPTWTQLKGFMEEQYRIMERIESNNRRTENHRAVQRGQIKAYQTSVSQVKCAACEKDHNLFGCETFRSMEVKDRWTLAKRKRLCFSCLTQHSEKLNCDKKKPCNQW